MHSCLPTLVLRQKPLACMHITHDVSTLKIAAEYVCVQALYIASWPRGTASLTSMPDCCQPSKHHTPGCSSKQKSEDDGGLRDAQAQRHSASVRRFDSRTAPDEPGQVEGTWEVVMI